MVHVFISLALLVSIVALLMAIIAIKSLEELKKECDSVVAQVNVVNETIDKLKNTTERQMAELTSMVSSNQTDIDNLREAHNILSDNFSAHLNGTYDGQTDKPKGVWDEDFKKECQLFVKAHKHEKTYEQLADILNVPTSTLKRWGKEILN